MKQVWKQYADILNLDTYIAQMLPLIWTLYHLCDHIYNAYNLRTQLNSHLKAHK